MLDRTRLLAVGLWGTFVGFLVVVTVFVRRFRRFERNREEINRRLIDLNDELRSLSEVANRTGNLVVITDVRGRIEWVNEAFELRTGYTLEEACGRTPGALLQGPETDPRTVEDMRAKIHAGQPFISEILNYTRAGAAYWVRLDVRPVVDADGILTGFVAVQTDVTEQREAQDLLRRAKEEAERAAEQKSQFLATMSHEIRTPLNAVIGLTDLLLDTDLDARQHEYAATARNSGTLLLETINDILCFSAVEAGGLQLECRDFDVRALAGGVGGVLAPQALEAGLRFAVRVEDRVPEALRGDEVRLRQVLVNVIANAIKFTETGGIDVVVDASPLGGGRHRVTIAVHDTGIGIPAAVLPSLFDPFTQGDASTTRRYGGSGLGLAITHRIIDVMGGEIDVESVVGAGTRFVVSVDLAEGKLEPERVEVAAIDLSPTRRLRILVAEDDPVNQMVIERMLERLGHDTTVVSEGAQAVAAALRSDYDVVLMDVQMPGVDGVDAMRRIRGELPAARQPQIVALTANALDGDRERLIAQGMDDYLSKPVQLAALRDMLATSTNTQLRATPGAVHHAVRADP
jgi:PAS domain S-box-containing protein